MSEAEGFVYLGVLGGIIIFSGITYYAVAFIISILLGLIIEESTAKSIGEFIGKVCGVIMFLFLVSASMKSGIS